MSYYPAMPRSRRLRELMWFLDGAQLNGAANFEDNSPISLRKSDLISALSEAWSDGHRQGGPMGDSPRARNPFQLSEPRDSVVPDVLWEQANERDEYGTPKHCVMGFTKNGLGPVDDTSPDWDHWGCWCGHPDCKLWMLAD